MTLGGKCLFFASPGSGVCSTFIRWSSLRWSDSLHTYFFVSKAVLCVERVRQAACHSVFLSATPCLQLSPCTWGICWVWIYDSYCYKAPLSSFMFFTLHSVLILKLPWFFLMKCLLLYDPHFFLLLKKKEENLLFWQFLTFILFFHSYSGYNFRHDMYLQCFP